VLLDEPITQGRVVSPSWSALEGVKLTNGRRQPDWQLYRSVYSRRGNQADCARVGEKAIESRSAAAVRPTTSCNQIQRTFDRSTLLVSLRAAACHSIRGRGSLQSVTPLSPDTHAYKHVTFCNGRKFTVAIIRGNNITYSSDARCELKSQQIPVFLTPTCLPPNLTSRRQRPASRRITTHHPDNLAVVGS